MDTKTLDSIIENILFVIPILHKKLLKIDPSSVCQEIRLSRLHVGIMAVINEGLSPSSEIGKKFLIPKPQMTLLINQLVKASLVNRQSNKFDRRITDLTLTTRGREALEQYGKLLKTNFREHLSFLSDRELEKMAILLARLREIGSKLETRE